MMEKLLANPYVGDGTLHPDMHLIYVDEVCGLFKLAGMPEDVVKKKVFVRFRVPQTLERFELWGACEELVLPSLPACRSHGLARRTKWTRDPTVYPGMKLRRRYSLYL